MRIAVYTDPLDVPEGGWPPDDFTTEAVRRLAAAHAGDQFMLISSGKELHAEAPNIRNLRIKGSPRRSVFSCRHVLRRLSRQLVLEKADVLVSMNGLAPPKPPAPCCLFVPRLPEGQGAAKSGSAAYAAGNLSRLAATASSITVSSAWAKEELATGYGVPADRITVVPRAVDEGWAPLDWEERERVKGDYTEGREYFLSPGLISERTGVIALMKAFSILKKRLRSNMVLVLAGEQDPAYRQFPELLRTYHFRDDVRITGALDAGEARRLVAAAYAMICPASLQSLAPAVIGALCCRVPVLAPSGGVLEETAGAAGLYFDASRPEDLGDQCCEIYKNENLRAEKAACCQPQAELYRWDRSCAALWSAILQAKK
jgi:glycosyltransferase involved in cell wall biosynthesis